MSIFDFIKANLPILNVIQEYTTLRPVGVYWKGLCPFHSEKTSSFAVSPHKDIFYCFGCHVSGDVIGFIAALENLSQLDAAKLLVEKYSLKVPVEILEQTDFNGSSDAKQRYFELCQLMAQWCHEQLKRNKAALQYLHDRAFTQEMIKKFCIGYCTISEIKSLLDMIKKENFLLDDLIEAGIVSPQKQMSSLYSGFDDRIIFPIKTTQGDYCGFGGRIFKPHDERAKYYNSKESPFFSKGMLLYGFDSAKSSMQQKNAAYLVEGYADCIAMVQQGITNTVATLGTACTVEHLKLLARFIEKIYVLYDGDDAGHNAVLRLTELAWHANLELRVISLPRGEDPASYIRNHGAIGSILQNNQSIYTFFIQSTKNDFQSKSLSEKLRAIKKLTEIIGNINDPIKQGILLQEMSKELSVPLGSIKQNAQLKQVVREHTTQAKEIERFSALELQVIGAVLHDATLIRTVFYVLQPFFSPQMNDFLAKIVQGDFAFIMQQLIPQEQCIAMKSYLLFKENNIEPEVLAEQFQKLQWKQLVSQMKGQLQKAALEKNDVEFQAVLEQFSLLKKKFIS